MRHEPPAGAGVQPHQGGVVRFVLALGAAARYRFFLFAGVFPYLLGSAVAYGQRGRVDVPALLLGLLGVMAVGVGIEGMNEYFDSRIGGDRVFASPNRAKPAWPLPVGAVGFAVAGCIAVALAVAVRWSLLVFAAAGLAAALSYLVPPVKLSYRGLGETVIALAYGPGLTLGAYHLQTGRLDPRAGAASLIPALLVLSLALANGVPDYYGDRLVGKRNLVVRLGPKAAVALYAGVVALCFASVVGGVLGGAYPPVLVTALLLLPLAVRNIRLATRDFRQAPRFRPVIRGTILLYALFNAVVTAGYLSSG